MSKKRGSKKTLILSEELNETAKPGGNSMWGPHYEHHLHTSSHLINC